VSCGLRPSEPSTKYTRHPRHTDVRHSMTYCSRVTNTCMPTARGGGRGPSASARNKHSHYGDGLETAEQGMVPCAMAVRLSSQPDPRLPNRSPESPHTHTHACTCTCMDNRDALVHTPRSAHHLTCTRCWGGITQRLPVTWERGGSRVAKIMMPFSPMGASRCLRRLYTTKRNTTIPGLGFLDLMRHHMTA
jgi:hypothetical protein